ncbi:MAG: hypothetical protein ABW133_08935, partial [Polyangiaceae bacterium]
DDAQRGAPTGSAAPRAGAPGSNHDGAAPTASTTAAHPTSTPPSGSPASSGATATPSASPVASPATPAAPPGEAALAALAGAWRSTSNRDYTAVVTTPGTLEFRIDRAAQHPRQGYQDGEVRFVLHTVAGKDDEFAVEDRLRPTPPPQAEYDPATSRESCVATWTTVKGKRLLAQVDPKGTLVVDLVQIRTAVDKFKIQGRAVTACHDVGAAPAEPIESRLTRGR